MFQNRDFNCEVAGNDTLLSYITYKTLYSFFVNFEEHITQVIHTKHPHYANVSLKP